MEEMPRSGIDQPPPPRQTGQPEAETAMNVTPVHGVQSRQSPDPAAAGREGQFELPRSVLRLQRNASLESLPAEIRREILCTLRYSKLRALVHASPVFHQQYQLDRRFILCLCLERTLRGATVDAWAAYRSGLPLFLDDEGRGQVDAMLDDYRERRSRPNYRLSAEGLAEDDVVAMARYHAGIVEPLAAKYLDWAYSFGNSIRWPQELKIQIEPLTATEEIRIFRALYRFQLCCNLFGIGEREIPIGSTKGVSYYTAQYILVDFLGAFEPWEAQEIACIYEFAHATLYDAFATISEDVRWSNPKFRERPEIVKHGWFRVDLHSCGTDYGNLLEGTVSRGLGLIHAVTIKFGDECSHEDLVTTLIRRIAMIPGYFLREAFSEQEQRTRRMAYPSDKDRKQDQRSPLPFQGDSEAALSDGSFPPLGWTWRWKGTYSNIFGRFVSNESQWTGYVFWDAVRIEKTAFGKQVKTMMQGDQDPRDGI